MSTPPRLTTSTRVSLIRSAIERVKRSQEHFRQVNANPLADTFQIEGARASLIAVVAEFGWQWENVESVLDALAPERNE